MMPPELVPHETRPRFTPQLVVGLIVIAVGVLMTLDNLQVVDAERYLRFWPGALIVLGVVKIWHSREGMGGSFGGFLFVVIGAWLLLEQTTLVRVSFWEMWPALLVAFGVFLVWQGLSVPRRRASAASKDLVSTMAVLGGVAQGNNSPAFRGGELTAVMGGCELDLRHAAIEGEAVIDVFALWGGIEIRVPEDWTVVSRITPILGGVDDKTRPPQMASRHHLVLRGFVVMAGVEVKN
jgi:predicted membrane protein